MYNLYQTDLRKEIQSNIYESPNFNITLFGKDYFGLIKEKKIGPFVIKWLQIMGVILPNDDAYVKSELERIKKIYKKEKGVVFIQLCLLNEIIRFENVGKRPDGFLDDMKKMRLYVRQDMKKKFGLETAFRENMPQANIIYDITKSDEKLIMEMNSGCKERVKKAIKNQIEFGVASPDQYELFYKKRKELGGQKGFNIISKKQYDKLTRYITQNNRGNLFTSTINGDIIAGSICLYDKHRIIYLYGFANRKYNNIGGHHYLKFKIFGHARKLGMTYVDMLGGAPTGFPEHPLNGVSKFKESLGGTKIEQYGSYDLIIRPKLYILLKMYFKIKHR